MTGKQNTRAKALLIAGPTASGKSALALALAERFGGLIVNADSMQIYRELRLLTARPSQEDEARAPHALYGFMAAAETFSVASYLAHARDALARADREGRIPIIVGGTGLYFEALLKGLARMPPVPAQVRAESAALMVELGPQAFHNRLAEVDPVMAARVRPTDRQRQERAYAVYRATGRSLAEWQEAPQLPLLATEETLRVVLMPERAALHARAAARLERMMEDGALEEVRALMALGLPSSQPILKALGVPPLRAYLEGRLTRKEALAEANTATRRYIKRQATWFRHHMMSWNWYFEQLSERNYEGIFANMAEKR